jgi:hypothetical protein
MLTDLHRGSEFGKQINEALAHMPVVHELLLGACSSIGFDAWAEIANGPVTSMTNLQAFTLDGCHIDLCDFSKMLLNMRSLTHLLFDDVHLYKASKGDLAQFFCALADGPCELEYFYSLNVIMGWYDKIEFPSSLRQPGSWILDSEGELEDDYDWIVVNYHPWIHWKGKDNIKWVLREMAAHVQSL